MNVISGVNTDLKVQEADSKFPITAGISGVIWIFGDKVVMTAFPRGRGWELPYVILTEETRLS